jgi:hypothetical protein
MTLEPRKDVEFDGYYIATLSANVPGEKTYETKYSVVDFGTTMKSTVDRFPGIKNAMFLGWEAIGMKKDGSLDSDEMFRTDTKERMIRYLEDLEGVIR